MVICILSYFRCVLGGHAHVSRANMAGGTEDSWYVEG